MRSLHDNIRNFLLAGYEVQYQSSSTGRIRVLMKYGLAVRWEYIDRETLDDEDLMVELLHRLHKSIQGKA